jgi:hypothetical protein
MRHLDLLAFIFRAYPGADPVTLGRMSRDGLLAWEREQARR